MPRIGPTELIIVLVIILIIFGAGRLPEIGSALGKGIKEFRKGQSDQGTRRSSSNPSRQAGRGRARRSSSIQAFDRPRPHLH